MLIGASERPNGFSDSFRGRIGSKFARNIEGFDTDLFCLCVEQKNFARIFYAQQRITVCNRIEIAEMRHSFICFRFRESRLDPKVYLVGVCEPNKFDHFEFLLPCVVPFSRNTASSLARDRPSNE